MSAIVTKIVEKYKLTPEMDISELSQYTSEFLENLTDDRKRNQARRRLRDSFKFSIDQVSILIPNQRGGRNKTINLVEGNSRIAVIKPPKSLEEEIVREITKRILQNRYGFSGNQVEALFSIQKNVQPKSINIVISKRQSLLSSKDQVPQETIGDMAQRILRDKLSIRDIRAEAYALALSALNANAGSSRLSRLRRELKNLGASSEIIEATKFPEITGEANEIQQNRRKFVETFERIDYPDHFTLESVKERLDEYDVSTSPDFQALADVMIMLCIRPAELTSLRITDAGVTGYAKNRNPGKPGVKWFNRFLKDYDLIPKYLRKIGAVYGAVIHCAKNPAHLMTIAGECLLKSSSLDDSDPDETDFISAIIKAKVGDQKVNCRLEPGFLGISMCTDKLLKKIGGKISRKLTSEEKDSKFVREETTAPLGLAIIPITFTSNVINNIHLSIYESITIPTKVLVEKYDPKMPNYILLGNNWFYGRNNHGIQMYLPEIVTDAKNAFVRTTLRIKDLSWKVDTTKAKKKPRVNVSVNKRDIHDFYKILPGKSKDSLPHRLNIPASSGSDTSDSITSDSNSDSSSTSSSEIEAIHKTEGVRKRPILKRKVKRKVNYRAL
ncbi:2834_t:CDS:2 [Entrophospora sp. SA101]|nr:2834_t:CDS:2 [Entrophospora sp. SA101]